MTHRLRLRDEKRKCELAGRPHTWKRPYARALRPAVEGITGRIGDALGLSQRLVEAWASATDPQHGPLVQLDYLIAESLEAGVEPCDALAPLHFLVDRHLDGIEAEGIGVIPAAADAVRQAAEAVAVAIDAVKDSRVTSPELDLIERNVHHAIEGLHRVRREAQAAHGRMQQAANAGA